MNLNYPKLFTPMKVGSLIFRNRILSGPNMISAMDHFGAPTDYLISYYAEKAKGGCAQVTTGDTPVEERGATNPNHPVLNKRTQSRWAELARAIRQHGAVACFELNHGGRIANPAITGETPIGPIDEVKANGVAVHGMTPEDMETVADAYAATAKLAKDAGFDMVMLHGGHGWLLGQMLSPKFNQRTDEFGGSLENRARFPLMVIERVRNAIGPKMPIEYRVGAEEVEGGLSEAELVEFCRMIEDRVELLHISAALDTDPQYAVHTHPTIFLPHMVNVHYAEAVKKAVSKVPVVAIGSITSPEEAESILEAGKADAVAMVRSLIADPYLPSKARKGRSEDIRPCLRCLDCLTGMQTTNKFACAVNPRAGHEARLDAELAPAREKKRVLIVGGGPGGMMAAITAAEQGHAVTLVDSGDRLGGLLRFTDYDALKQDLGRLKNWLVGQVEKHNIKVLLNTVADEEFVLQFAPDALLIATGSEPIVFPLPGIERAQHATTAYTRLDTLGQRVAVMGGGLVGCETALFLQESGHQVTIIEMQDTIAPDANWMHRTGMLQAFAKTNLAIRTGLRCMAVTEQGVETQAKDGSKVLIEADSVVYAFGQRSRSPLDFMSLPVPEIRVIGDCRQVGKTNGAIFDAYHAALDL